jgi:hypothetical protein
MPRNWQAVVRSDEFTNVMRLVHLAMRQTEEQQESIRAALLKQRRREYEATLTEMARAAGCTGRRGRLDSGPILSELNEESKRDAESIVNTYNFDLGVAIQAVHTETPTANRFTYAKRLGDWERTRSKWKDPQVSMNTALTARSKAQEDFARFNPEALEGTAILMPRTAAEPICAGFVARGEVPGRVAIANPSPWHPNCPHVWIHQPAKIPREDCADLWLGS